MKPLATCILAAGKGTRMRSSLAKVLHPLAGVPMLGHVLAAVRGLEPVSSSPNVVIVGHQAEAVEAELARGLGGGLEMRTARQEPQLGTGHAVQVAADQFRDLAAAGGDLLVLLGDVPLITAATLTTLIEHHRAERTAATMLTMRVEDPGGYGRVTRDEAGRVTGVVEQKDAAPAQLAIDEVNTGIFVFDAAAALARLDALSNDNAQGEYYLPQLIPLLLADGLRCAAVVAGDAREGQGINSQRQLADADLVLRERILEDLLAQGVRIPDPRSTYIEADVTIGADTIIHPFCVIRAGVRIGSHCEVGPFAHLRLDTHMHDRSAIGNFCEAKKATIGAGSKAKHLTYLGDVTIGQNANIGAGTVIANYDGTHKHRTHIGDGVFIGSGSMVVAPRTISEGARTGAGSVVTKDVPPHTTVYGVPARPSGKRIVKK